MADPAKVQRMYELVIELTNLVDEYRGDLREDLRRRDEATRPEPGEVNKLQVVVEDWLVPACDSMIRLLEDDFMPFLNRVYNTGAMMSRPNFEQDIIV
jgi:hypothetical protein